MMNTKPQRIVFFHGWVVMLLGWLNAAPYALAIVLEWDAEVVRAWRVAHTGVSGAAATVILAAPTLGFLVLSDHARRIVAYAMSFAGYCFGIGLTIGALVSHRGLTPAPPAPNVLVFAFNGTGTIAAAVGGFLIVVGAWRALKQENAATG